MRSYADRVLYRQKPRHLHSNSGVAFGLNARGLCRSREALYLPYQVEVQRENRPTLPAKHALNGLIAGAKRLTSVWKTTRSSPLRMSASRLAKSKFTTT